MLKDRQELRAFREECVRAYNAYKRKILVCAGARLRFQRLAEHLRKAPRAYRGEGYTLRGGA